MSQYLDQQGLQTLVTKTKEYARKSAKEAVNTSAAAASKTITGWNGSANAAEYGDIAIAESQVTGLTADLNLKAPLASPAFTGTPTTPTPEDPEHNTTQIANVQYVLDVVGNITEAMHYIGAINSESGLRTSGKAGDTYKVATAGSYLGYNCEVGDMIIANKDYTTELTHADVDVIQTNIDGAVTGPNTAVSGNFALFDNANGKVIADAGFGPNHFKTVQQVSAYTGAALKTIDTINQNTNGDITVTFQDIQTATTAQAGVVTLSNASANDAQNVAATPYAVKAAYDVLNDAKQDKLSFDGEYDATNNKVATVSTVSDAIEALDAEVTSTDGKNVQFKVTEEDGKITGVSVTTDNTVNETDVSNAITAAIGGLDAAVSAIAPSATITSIAETDGVISITSGAIAITTDQITDFSTVLNGKADKVTSATAGHIATFDATGNLTDGGFGLDHYKTVQTAVSDPTATGTAVAFIDSIEQDTNGEITVTKKTVQNATTAQAGLMSAEDFTKLGNMSVSSVAVTDGVLLINGSSAMGPISDSEINSLFD